MSYAGQLMEKYFQRTGRPDKTALDAAYQYQVSVLRDLLERLEVILVDNGVDGPTSSAILRQLLYGAPSVADAELRISQHQRLVELTQTQMPAPMQVWPRLG